MPEKILRGFFNTWTIWTEEFQLKFKDPEKWNNFPLGICRNLGFGQFGFFYSLYWRFTECKARIQIRD